MSILQQRINECLRLADHARLRNLWNVYRHWMKKAAEYGYVA